jgi:hypothetical protein
MSCEQYDFDFAGKRLSSGITIWQDIRDDTTCVYIETDVAIRGLHLNLIGPQKSVPIQAGAPELDMVHGQTGDTLKVGLVDLDGPGVVEPGTQLLLRAAGRYEVALAQAASLNHRTLSLAVKSGNPSLPTRYELSHNYPNPFNPTTTIEFALPRAGHVELTVYNVLGQVVTSLMDEDLPAGYHSVTWEASRYASGVYFYRLKAGDYVRTRKMMLLK